MSQVKALIDGLLHDPGAIRCLIEDPQGFARLAGLGEAELKALGGVSSAVGSIWNRLTSQTGIAAPSPGAPAHYVSYPRVNGSRPQGGNSVAIAGAVSLLAVVGAVVTVGTVSLVALSRKEDQTP